MTLTVVQHDHLDGPAPLVPADSVDLVVTSPPYKPSDGYSDELMATLGVWLARVMRPGARAFVNFGQLRGGFHRPLAALDELTGPRALCMAQTIVWVKSVAMKGLLDHLCAVVDRHASEGAFANVVKQAIKEVLGGGAAKGHVQPISTKYGLNYGWEYLWHLYRPPEEPLDRLAVGVPFADKSNLKRDTRGKHGDRRCGGDVWMVPYSTTGKIKKKAHRHEFPEALVERCINLSGVPMGSMILDPFGGGGTVARVALRMGMHAVVVDRDPEACRTVRETCESLIP